MLNIFPDGFRNNINMQIYTLDEAKSRWNWNDESNLTCDESGRSVLIKPFLERWFVKISGNELKCSFSKRVCNIVLFSSFFLLLTFSAAYFKLIHSITNEQWLRFFYVISFQVFFLYFSQCRRYCCRCCYWIVNECCVSPSPSPSLPVLSWQLNALTFRQIKSFQLQMIRTATISECSLILFDVDILLFEHLSVCNEVLRQHLMFCHRKSDERRRFIGEQKKKKTKKKENVKAERKWFESNKTLYVLIDATSSGHPYLQEDKRC